MILSLLENFKDPLRLALAISIVLIFIVVIVIIAKMKKKTRVIKVLDSEFFDKIINAIGSDNINSIKNNNDRIIISLKNVSLVKSNFFVEEKLGAFVTKNELKFVLRDNANEFVKYTKSLLK